MSDAKIHLRNCNTGLSGNQTTSTDAAGTVWASGTGLVQYAWDPATPNHTLMDQYCFSCHNSAGAPTAIAALAGVTNISVVATNPFNDTISNQYDLLSRGAVVDAFSQFATGNSSHHAVRGAKYTATTLVATTFSNISSANFTNGTKGVKTLIATIKDAGKFSTLYTALGTGTTLTDASVIHCGDCHTVGQFKPNSTKDSAGNLIANAIGAHGSDNEYLLRKANGSESHATATKDALVCNLCHAASQYQTGIHESVSHTTGNDCNGNSNNYVGLVGNQRLRGNPFTAYSTQIQKGNYSGGGGNSFANQCLNCHNAGAGTAGTAGKIFGGIHGNANNYSYTSYSGGTTDIKTVSRKPYRFLPGLGNFRYNGGNSSAQWTLKAITTTQRLGCYTLNGASTKFVNGALLQSPSPSKALKAGTNVSTAAIADDNGVIGTWGSCTDHVGSSMTGGGVAPTRDILRPLTY
jgi:mono/diheme cytochrome c family protein